MPPHNLGDSRNAEKEEQVPNQNSDLMMKLFRSDDKFSQMLTQYESTPESVRRSDRWRDYDIADDEDGGEDEEDEEDRGGGWGIVRDVYIVAREVARERIPGELSPSNYPGRHVARDEYPQRHVAREGVKMSLGIVVNVVVLLETHYTAWKVSFGLSTQNN
ncbi:hypothetical protein Tco_0727461 [Tanacetum coccineum]|uniref:Uncharacterized protein n=1 Tax=Tanacetum coccineum TaxID=301880 RepID=A0ABQ4YJ08_9ASTR